MTSEQPVDRPAVSLPLRRTCPYSPPAEYTELRERSPVSRVAQPDGREIWAVTRHEDVRAVLADPRFSSDPTHPGYPRLVPVLGELAASGPKTMLSLDAPEHTEARRAVVGEFTVKRMNALKPRIRQIVDEHVDAMLAGPRPVDLVRALAVPTPSLVICEQLGVPYEDHDFFQTHSARLTRHDIPTDVRMRSSEALLGYLEELIRSKEAEPTDDLLGRQVRKQREAGRGEGRGDRETHRGELVALALLLLAAGHETTANMISLGTLEILRRPELRRRLTAAPGERGGPGDAGTGADAGPGTGTGPDGDPDAVANLVEELLRYYSVADFGTTRVAMEDVELGGVRIPAGDGVVALQGAANHDPDVFPRPGDVDVARGARHHVAFGYGPHQCLGQNLARLELRITYETLFRRIPGLRLAVPYEELEYRHNHVVFGLHELPVTW